MINPDIVQQDCIGQYDPYDDNCLICSNASECAEYTYGDVTDY